MGKGIPANIDIVKAMDKLLANPRTAFSPEAVRRVRDEVVQMRGMKDEVEKIIRDLSVMNEGLGRQLVDLKTEIQRLQQIIEQKSAQINSLTLLLASKDEAVIRLSSEVDSLIDAAAVIAVDRQMKDEDLSDDLDFGILADEAQELLRRIARDS